MHRLTSKGTERVTVKLRGGVRVPLLRKMLRYLIKTLLQMNLFTDTVQNPSNGTDLFFNSSMPSFNGSLLDWGNFTGFNGKCRELGRSLPPLACLNLPFDLYL